MMVERKLSGVYTTLQVDVAYEHFESYVDTLMDNMERFGVKKTRLEVCENPLVQKAFEQVLSSITEYIEFDEAYHYVNDETVEICFKPEVEEIRRKEEEARREAARKKAEEERIQREKDALTETTIVIDKKHLNKATAILQAAGLLKKDK